MKKVVLWLIAIFLGLPLLLAFVGAFSTPSKAPAGGSTPQGVSDPVTTPAPPQPKLTAAQREKRIAEATKGLRMTRDKMEQVNFYEAGSGKTYKSEVGAYITLSDGSHTPYLRFKTRYHGDSWVFMDKIKIMADDVVIYDRELKRSDIIRDNSSGSVWEQTDVLADESDLSMIKKLAAAKSATIRFAGRERINDHKISKQEVANLAKTVESFELLRASLLK